MVKASICVHTEMEYGGEFEAETLAEAIATAELESVRHSEIQSRRIFVAKVEKLSEELPPQAYDPR